MKSISGEKSSVSGENNELVKSISERRFNGDGSIRGEKNQWVKRITGGRVSVGESYRYISG